MSDTTIPPPGVFSCSPSSSVNLQHASLTLDHPPIYQSLVFYLLPFSFFLSSSLPLLQYISLLHLIPFHYSFRLHHISLFPVPFFFLHLSHSCLDRLRDVGQLFPHSVFKSQTATVPHDSSRKPRPGRHWGSGGRVTRGLLALICVKNAVGQIFSRFNVSVCYSEVRGVRQLLVGVFFRKTGATCKY